MKKNIKNIKEIYDRTIPQKVKEPYYKLYKLLLEANKNYNDIINNDIESLRKKILYSKTIETNDKLISKLKDISNREKLLSTYQEIYYYKMKSGIGTISNYETQKLEKILNEKRDLILKLKEIYSKLDKENKDRQELLKKIIELESKIEDSRKKLNKNIKDIKFILNDIKQKNITVERIKNLEITYKHIKDIDEYLIEDYKNKKIDFTVNRLIKAIFRNNFEIEKNMLENIYYASVKCIEDYNKHSKIDFTKIDEINTIMNIGILNIFDDIIPSTLGEFGKEYLNENYKISNHVLNIIGNNYNIETVKGLEKVYSMLNNKYTKLNVELFSSYLFTTYQKESKKRKIKRLS